MGVHYVAVGPAGYTHEVYYVCDPRCLSNGIAEHVSAKWAEICDRRDAWYIGDTVYMIGYTSNENDGDDHAYCWACGDLVFHGDECTVTDCDKPEYVEV